MNEWIGVDLDGTLAEYDDSYNDTYIGEPIPLMIDRVKQWITDGLTVKIFTARVSSMNPYKTEAISLIKTWCVKHIGVELDITAEKDHGMTELWDDRCVSVETNTSIIKSTDCLRNEIEY